MVSSEMVERVAKALALEMYPDTRWPADEQDADYGIDDCEGRYPVSWHYAQKCRSQARVAIAAMREPSSAVEYSADKYLNELFGSGRGKHMWQAMIDAALKEGD